MFEQTDSLIGQRGERSYGTVALQLGLSEKNKRIRLAQGEEKWTGAKKIILYYNVRTNLLSLIAPNRAV